MTLTASPKMHRKGPLQQINHFLKHVCLVRGEILSNLRTPLLVTMGLTGLRICALKSKIFHNSHRHIICSKLSPKLNLESGRAQLRPSKRGPKLIIQSSGITNMITILVTSHILEPDICIKSSLLNRLRIVPKM